VPVPERALEQVQGRVPEQVREVSAVFRVAGAIDFDLQLIWHFAGVDWREPHAPNSNRVGTRRLCGMDFRRHG